MAEVPIDSVQPRLLPAAALYRVFWRWHFFAGLVVAPVLIMLAVTGSMILYEEEIEGVLYRDVLVVPARSTAEGKSDTSEAASEGVSEGKQEAAVRLAYPGASIIRFTLPRQPDRVVEWMIRTAEGEVLVIGVNPADGTITGMIEAKFRLSTVLSNLHGELQLGRTGSYVVEFAACWAIVLLVTGVVLWWPRQPRLAGNAFPRLQARGRRFWRDLHAVPSAWNLPVIAFLLLTGLPWSVFWGEQLSRLGTLSSSPALFAPTPNFSAWPSASTAVAASDSKLEHHAQARDLPWAIRRADLPVPPGPASTTTTEGAHHDPVAPYNDRQMPGNAINADVLMGIAAERDIGGGGLRVIYPMDAAGVYTLSYVPDTAEAQRTVHVNPADGRILQDIGWREYSALGKVVEFGVIVHMGRQFGELNRLLLLASCLLLVATVAAGFVTWWKRKPQGRIAPPPMPPWIPVRTVLPVMATLGLLFPLVGASMLLLTFCEWWFAKRSARG